MAKLPVSINVKGLKDLNTKVKRINRGLNNLGIKMSALKATLLKLRNDLRKSTYIQRGK